MELALLMLLIVLVIHTHVSLDQPKLKGLRPRVSIRSTPDVSSRETRPRHWLLSFSRG
ncbi:hypothetical protein SAMD00079811_50840 [Scytonema sp. HK-05]|nr:hypothetical protein SAMD00079811_50840 [Scytonema sp. HK-05]